MSENETGSSIWKEAVNAIGGLLHRNHQELLKKFDVPTPQKISYQVIADANGNIGGGMTNPSPVIIWQCPMSQEAWIHRLAVSSPAATPKTPLTTGEAVLVDGSESMLFFLPVGGVVAPVIAAEGYGSAIHLNAGSRISVYGDSFAAGTALRFDLQVSLTRGISQYTPTNHPTEYVTILEG